MYAEARLSPKIIKYVDCFVAWGPRPRDIIHTHTGFPKESIPVAGNPRFDLLHQGLGAFYGEEVRRLKLKFNDFILFNTNFVRANPFGEESKKFWLVNDTDRTAYQRKLYDHFLEAIGRLSSDFPHLNIVIRPHPSENHGTYKEIFHAHRNVFVEHWGNVHPWILASKVSVHNSCTTGIESALAAKPVIAYRPISDEKHDLYLPNLVSVECTTYDALVQTVSRLVEGGASSFGGMTPAQAEELRKYFHHADGQAAHRISDFLLSLEVSPVKSFETVFETSPRQRHKRLLARAFGGYYILSRVAKWRRLKFGKTYGEQKFPRLSKRELESKIRRLQALANIPETVIVKKIPELSNCFWILERSGGDLQ
jgi:hypothetical protein